MNKIICFLLMLGFVLNAQAQLDTLLKKERQKEYFESEEPFSKEEEIYTTDYKFHEIKSSNLNLKGEVCVIENLKSTYYRGLDGGKYEATFSLFESENGSLKNLIWKKNYNGYLEGIDDNFLIIEVSPEGWPSHHFLNLLTGEKIVETEAQKPLVITEENYQYYVNVREYLFDNSIHNRYKNRIYDRTILLWSSNEILQLIHVYKMPHLRHYKNILYLSFDPSNNILTIKIGEDIFNINYVNKRFDLQNELERSEYFIVKGKIEYSDDYLSERRFTEISKNSSKYELRLLRNEIFARHGHSFNSKDLIEYFSSKSWYKTLPNKNITIEDFTIREIEMFNEIRRIELIKN